ncbi:hypothetical protein SDC9_74023 [bioreactor metagenome]|uniref:Xylose isomerase-like TIM barrel domain-containing protein n=1 Tax=bioreactor metagenome TaxID=1076179 RepID=A0A644YHZ5_9ZZZZ|nr:sugar phosphate isomerase/epimerase [Petrimonas sp.]
MKNKEIFTGKLSRRSFLGAAAVVTAASVIPFSASCGSTVALAGRAVVPDSKFGGVQIGAITYSFRDMPGGLETVLKACVDAGLSSVELMGTGVEDYLGAPRQVSDAGKKAQDQYNRDLKEWRKVNGTLDKYAQLRKKFNDAGVKIHIYKWVAGNSEEELDYSFKVAKALGAIGISAELNDNNARLMGPVAARNGMYAILHNHYQFGETGFDVDRLLAYSPANMLNFDIGHYLGSTGLNPADFIQKYHNRIASIHVKDKTSANNTVQKNTNQVFGQGETPIAEVLRLIQKEKWPVYCDIELEYPVAPWSTSVKEVKTCMEYCRQILI